MSFLYPLFIFLIFWSIPSAMASQCRSESPSQGRGQSFHFEVNEFGAQRGELHRMGETFPSKKVKVLPELYRFRGSDAHSRWKVKIFRKTDRLIESFQTPVFRGELVRYSDEGVHLESIDLKCDLPSKMGCSTHFRATPGTRCGTL